MHRTTNHDNTTTYALNPGDNRNSFTMPSVLDA